MDPNHFPNMLNSSPNPKNSNDVQPTNPLAQFNQVPPNFQYPYFQHPSQFQNYPNFQVNPNMQIPPYNQGNTNFSYPPNSQFPMFSHQGYPNPVMPNQFMPGYYPPITCDGMPASSSTRKGKVNATGKTSDEWDEIFEKFQVEKMEVMRKCMKTMNARNKIEKKKNKIEEKRNKVKEDRIKMEEIGHLFKDNHDMTDEQLEIHRNYCKEIRAKYNI